MSKILRLMTGGLSLIGWFCTSTASAQEGDETPQHTIRDIEREYIHLTMREVFAQAVSAEDGSDTFDIIRFRNSFLADVSFFDEVVVSSEFYHHGVTVVLGHQNHHDIDLILGLAADIACAGYRRALSAWVDIHVPEGPTHRQHLVVEGLSRPYPGANGILHIEDDEDDKKLYEEAVRDLEFRQDLYLRKSALERKFHAADTRYKRAFRSLLKNLSSDNIVRMQQHLIRQSDKSIDFITIWQFQIEPKYSTTGDEQS